MYNSIAAKFDDDLSLLRRRAREEFRVGADHEHSSMIEECQNYKVVVCYKHVHMSMTIIACCVVQAELAAEIIFRRDFHLNVEVAEIWDHYDIEKGEPGETFYPDFHDECRMQGEVLNA